VKPAPGVRPSPIAGKWYPADPHQLARQIDQFLEEAGQPVLAGPVVGVMAPHAGHRYSGAVAGHAFAAVRGLAPELVVLAGPMHFPYRSPVLTSAHAAYATPLGQVGVDQAALEELSKALERRGLPTLAPVLQDQEHALEIELPFLQRALAQTFAVLPLMVRDNRPQVCQALGEALVEVLQPWVQSDPSRVLLVASTDLSHFYQQAAAEQLDAAMLGAVRAFDPVEVLAVEERGEGFACGRGALAAIMWAALGLGAQKAQILNYATSGMITSDFEQVVGYAAAVFTRS
jgi:MEMO1 family protein